MARSMVSLGMLAARASSIARRRRGFESGAPPPIRAATVMALEHLVQTLPRLLSSKAFLCLMLDEWEWPAMGRLRYAGGPFVNDEGRSTNDERNPNDECLTLERMSHHPGHSHSFGHWSFVIL